MSPEDSGNTPSRVERFAQVLKETVGDHPHNVYYPGIGGVEEPLDFMSAFTVVDADTVHGVDLWDYGREVPDEEIGG